MNAIRHYESLIATANEYARHGMTEEAARLRAEAQSLLPEVEAARGAVRAAAGGHLAALADAAARAQEQPQTPAWHDPTMTPEREARIAKLRAEALGALRPTTNDVDRHREAREREHERLRRGQ